MGATITLIADNFSPITQGDTLIAFSPQFGQYVNGVLEAFDLAGLTISLKLQSQNDSSIVIAGTGTWTIDNAPGGQAHYVWSSADVATPGVWVLFINLTNTVSGAYVHTFNKTLQINAAV